MKVIITVKGTANDIFLEISDQTLSVYIKNSICAYMLYYPHSKELRSFYYNLCCNCVCLNTFLLPLLQVCTNKG